jgi:hypothetical protein
MPITHGCNSMKSENTWVEYQVGGVEACNACAVVNANKINVV